MKKTYIGLNTYLYTYPLEDKEVYLYAYLTMQKYGEVKKVFLNNELGFELRVFVKR